MCCVAAGGDFAAFQSATPQQADFANFQAAPVVPPPVPVQGIQPTGVSATSLGGFSGFQGAAAPQPTVAMASSQPAPQPTVAMASSQPAPLSVMPSSQPAPLSASQLMQQQPVVMQVRHGDGTQNELGC